MEQWQLKQMQGLPLEVKIEKTKLRIREWYDYWNGQVYVSFSGGKDSTVLLHIVREMYPDVKAVFVDTGLEYPEIREFVKSINNVIWVKPKMNFREVINTYGYPVISKEVSRDVCVARNKPNGKTADKFKPDSDYTKKYGMRWCLEKYSYLLNAPFKISNRCCHIMKKEPLRLLHKDTGLYPIIATMACESALRKKDYLQTGCNAFDNKKPISKPLSFWTEQDVLQYIKQYNIKYASVYGDIVEQNGILSTTGCDRTGCMFCMFGCHLEKEPNRFQRMKLTHPKQYKYCIENLNLGKVLDYIGVKY